MNIRKIIYIILGWIGLALGAVGAAVPLLPAFPFLLLAAICFGKGSKKLDQWFKSTSLYQNNLASFVKGEGMTLKAKIRVLLIVTIAISIGFLMMENLPIGRFVLIAVYIGHILYFVFKVKTIDKPFTPLPATRSKIV